MHSTPALTAFTWATRWREDRVVASGPRRVGEGPQAGLRGPHPVRPGRDTSRCRLPSRPSGRSRQGFDGVSEGTVDELGASGGKWLWALWNEKRRALHQRKQAASEQHRCQLKGNRSREALPFPRRHQGLFCENSAVYCTQAGHDTGPVTEQAAAARDERATQKQLPCWVCTLTGRTHLGQAHRGTGSRGLERRQESTTPCPHRAGSRRERRLPSYSCENYECVRHQVRGPWLGGPL